MIIFIAYVLIVVGFAKLIWPDQISYNPDMSNEYNHSGRKCFENEFLGQTELPSTKKTDRRNSLQSLIQMYGYA